MYFVFYLYRNIWLMLKVWEYPVINKDEISNVSFDDIQFSPITVMCPDHIYRVKWIVLAILENDRTQDNSDYHRIYQWLDSKVARFENRFLETKLPRSNANPDLITNTPFDASTKNQTQIQFLKTLERFDVSNMAKPRENTAELLNAFFLLQDAMNLAMWLNNETKEFLFTRFEEMIKEFNILLDKEISTLFDDSLNDIKIPEIWDELEKKTWDNCSDSEFEDVMLIVRIINEFSSSLFNPWNYISSTYWNC